MSIKIEDNATEVLRKVMLGKGISSEMLAEKSRLPLAQVRRLRRQRADEATCSRIACALGLSPEKLKRLDEKFDAAKIAGIANDLPLPEICSRHIMFCGNKVLPEMTSNAYVLTDEAERRSVLFDCGMNASDLVDLLKSRKTDALDVCLTHRHFDHADGLRELTDAFPNLRIWDFSTFCFSERFFAVFECGKFRLRAISVPGHTKDSVVYVWENPPYESPPIAFTGDTLFLGSVGGCLPGKLQESIENIRSRLFNFLDPKTIVAPGHGPGTTLDAEISENPFF